MTEYKIKLRDCGVYYRGDWDEIFFRDHISKDSEVWQKLTKEGYYRGEKCTEIAVFDTRGKRGVIVKIKKPGDEQSPNVLLKIYEKAEENNDSRLEIISNTIDKWFTTKENSDIKQYFIQYQYFSKGYLDWSNPQIKGPLLFMEQVNTTLRLSNEYLSHADDKETSMLTEAFRKLISVLDHYNVGFGDLSPDNILIKKDEAKNPQLILIDYDDVYVPEMNPNHDNEIRSFEAGSPHFQHPQRNFHHDNGWILDERIHRFSSILLYLSLLALSKKRNVYQEFILKNAEQYQEGSPIIFNESDLSNPDKSIVFDMLRGKKDSDDTDPPLQFLAEKLAEYAKLSTAEEVHRKIPSLSDLLLNILSKAYYDYQIQEPVFGITWVHFNDKSENSPVTWLWSFGDGKESAEKSPRHMYNEPGTYRVKLTVSNAIGSDSTSKTIVIPQFEKKPIARFRYELDNNKPIFGLVLCKFWDESGNNPSRRNWDFGDSSNISTALNPVHSFNIGKSYTIKLTVYNDYGTSTTSQKIDF